MDCAETETLLIDYHFALGPGAQLEAVHAHLRRCIRCAQSYLDLKHAVDSGAALEAAPSPARRARLRAEVGAMFQPNRLARARQCESERGKRPTILAVDFALTGDVVGAAAVMNGTAGPSPDGPTERTP